MPQLHRPYLQPFVARLSSRSILSDEEQQAILSLPGSVQQVETNRDFVPLGVRVDYSTLVLDGLVGRFDQTSDGARQITALHIPGDMADLHSVVQPVPTSALQALSVTSILCIPHRSIRAAAARYPAIAEAFWRDCMVDAAILAQWVVNVGCRDAKRRIAHLMCELATRLSARAAGDGVEFELYMTQTQMAEMTAMTAVHVNRTLQNLRSTGLLTWQAGVVRLPRWAALIELAEFDAAYLQTKLKPEQRMRLARSG